MDFFDKLKKHGTGGYIFLSHSHEDIDKVREIRNSLEKNGFEPLCFYLKCLNDDSEIEDLIKREIDAREWFVFINSENAQKSKWVTLEREYIAKTNEKKILTIDINDEESIKNTLKKISEKLRVFISYSAKDRDLARRIKNKLQDKDYSVFFAPDDLPVGKDWTSVITNEIAEASKCGCVIALITSNSIQSLSIKRELEFALNENGNIIPVIIGDIKLDVGLKYLFAHRQMYFLPENPRDDDIEAMISKIGFDIVSDDV